MGLRISTNVPSLSIQRNLSRNADRTAHALEALASGNRVVRASDDAAGYAIAEGLRGQSASLKVAKQNAENAIGFIQVAEGGLNEQNNILVRLHELAIQAASDTVGDKERGYLDTEFQQLSQELDRIADTTRFGNKKLLSGESSEYVFQLGTSNGAEDTVHYKLDANTRASALGISGLSVSDQDSARSMLPDLDEAIQKVSQARAGFGAIQSRLQIASNNLDEQHENIESARSRMVDADVAYEVSEMTQGKLIQEFGVAALAHANMSADSALRLLS